MNTVLFKKSAVFSIIGAVFLLAGGQAAASSRIKDIADFENNPALIKDFWQEQTNTAIAKLEDIKNNIADKPYSKKMDKYFEETRYLDYINHYAKDITDKTDKNTYQLLESSKQAVKDLNEFIYDKIRRR